MKRVNKESFAAIVATPFFRLANGFAQPCVVVRSCSDSDSEPLAEKRKVPGPCIPPASRIARESRWWSLVVAVVWHSLDHNNIK